MAEQMTDQTPRVEVPEQPSEVRVGTGQFIDRESLLRTYLAGNAPSDISEHVLPKTSAADTEPITLPVAGGEHHRLSEKARKRIRNSLVATAIAVPLGAVLIAAGTYVSSQYNDAHADTKAAGHSTHLPPVTTRASVLPNNGITMEKAQAYGQASLEPQYCMLPGAVMGVWTVSGTMNLQVELNNTQYPSTLVPLNANLFPRAPFETGAALKALKNYNTPSGFPELTLNNLPLGLTVCDLDNAVTYNPNTDSYVVDRSKLQLKFEGPNSTSMIDVNMMPAFQTGSAKDIKTDPTKGQYSTIPDPNNNMFVPVNPTDAVYNASRAKFLTDMQSTNQFEGLMALAEKGAAADINGSDDTPVPKDETITYVGTDISKYTEAVDYLITERLGSKKVKFITGTKYNATSDTPIAKNTRPITDPAAGYIKGINTNVGFDITDLTVQFGSVKVPPSPTTSATPTPIPTEKSAP
jgi:hypothetical protein